MQQHNNCFVAITEVNLCQAAPLVKNWRILLEQSFTACMLLLMATWESWHQKGKTRIKALKAVLPVKAEALKVGLSHDNQSDLFI